MRGSSLGQDNLIILESVGGAWDEERVVGPAKEAAVPFRPEENGLSQRRTCFVRGRGALPLLARNGDTSIRGMLKDRETDL